MPTMLPARKINPDTRADLWLYLHVAVVGILLSLVTILSVGERHVPCLADQMGPIIPVEMLDVCR